MYKSLSYLDDVEEELCIERAMLLGHINEVMNSTSDQRIVYDCLSLFRVGDLSKADQTLLNKSKEILKTIAKYKRVSIKQKQVLCRLLCLEHEDYESNSFK